MRTTEGNVLVVEETFLNDLDEPLFPREDDVAPIVSLIDPEDKSVLAQVVATPGEIPWQWTADVAVPNMGLTDDKRFTLTWR